MKPKIDSLLSRDVLRSIDSHLERIRVDRKLGPAPIDFDNYNSYILSNRDSILGSSV